MYLALGGVYLLLSAVCSNNATLRDKRLSHCTQAHVARWVLHPPWNIVNRASTLESRIECPMYVTIQITIRHTCRRGCNLPSTQNFAAGLVAEEIVRWAVPFSLAATKGIAFAFFSSAY